MRTKKCYKCQELQPITEFYRCKRDGYQSKCKKCGREETRARYNFPASIRARREAYERLKREGYFAEYFQRADVKERQVKNQTRYYRNPQNRIKCLARAYARRMIKNGTIEKEPCAMCGKQQSQLHHPDYTQPLLIVWLCPNCHRQVHKAKIDGGE